MPSEATPPESDTRLVVATERTARGMSTATFLAQLLRRLPGMVGVLLAGIAAWLHTPLGPWGMILPAAAAVLMAVVWRNMHQQTRQLVPPGTAIQTTFTPTLLMVQTSGGRANLRLSAMKGVRRIGGYVVFRVKEAYFAYPKEVFPPEEIKRLRRRR